MLSGVNGWFAIGLTVVMAVVLESAKVIFFTKALSSRNLSLGMRSTIFIISALLFISSIVASLSFMFNQSNESKNVSIQNSTEYKQSQENRNILLNQIKAIEQEKQTLINQANSLPKNYYSMKDTIMDKVTSKNKEIERIASQVQNQKLIVNTADTKGYKAFTHKIANLVGTESENVELFIFGALAIIFEICAGLLFYISSIESPKRIENTNVQHRQPIFNRVNLQTFGPKPEQSKSFSGEDIKTYINYMYDNSTNDTSPGYMKISEKTNLPLEVCRKIKGYLEQTNVTRTEGRTTKILKSREEVKV